MADGSVQVALAGAPPGQAWSWARRILRRRSTLGFLICLPLIAVVGGLVIYPALYAIWLSMLSQRMAHFVGVANFAFLLTRSTFHLVIFQSCFFALSAVALKATLGFTLAHLMHNITGGRQRLWRGLLLVPWVIPLAMSSLGWSWVFDPSYSALNWFCRKSGQAVRLACQRYRASARAG